MLNVDDTVAFIYSFYFFQGCKPPYLSISAAISRNRGSCCGQLPHRPEGNRECSVDQGNIQLCSVHYKHKPMLNSLVAKVTLLVCIV